MTWGLVVALGTRIVFGWMLEVSRSSTAALQAAWLHRRPGAFARAGWALRDRDPNAPFKGVRTVGKSRGRCCSLQTPSGGMGVHRTMVNPKNAALALCHCFPWRAPCAS